MKVTEVKGTADDDEDLAEEIHKIFEDQVATDDDTLFVDADMDLVNEIAASFKGAESADNNLVDKFASFKGAGSAGRFFAADTALRTSVFNTQLQILRS